MIKAKRKIKNHTAFRPGGMIALADMLKLWRQKNPKTDVVTALGLSIYAGRVAKLHGEEALKDFNENHQDGDKLLKAIRKRFSCSDHGLTRLRLRGRVNYLVFDEKAEHLISEFATK